MTSSMRKYKLVCKKGEGTFSEVVKAENLEMGTFHAIKCMKENYSNVQKVNNLREIQALRRLTPHPHIVNLEEVLYDQPTGRLAIVFELMEKNLYDLISGRRNHLDSELTKSLAHQLFTALKHCHDRGIFHRDIKPENILVDESGKLLKLADFGSCRGTHSKQPFTGYIATRWYRAPECLITDGYYGSEMDVWGAGSVLFELVSLYPLFPGSDEVDQLNRIHKVVGTPSNSALTKLKLKSSLRADFNFPVQQGVGIKHFIPHASLDCVSLISKTLIYDISERIDATGALNHRYFGDLDTAPPELVPEVTSKVNTNANKNSNSNTTSTSNNSNTIRKHHKPNPPNRNPQEPSSGRSRLPKRTGATNTNVADHRTKTKIKQTGRPKVKRVKPTEETHNSETTKPKPTRRRRPAGTLPKLSNTTTHEPPKRKQTFQSHNTTKRHEDSKPAVPKRRPKRYANVTSSGYGSSAYKPTHAERKKKETKPTKLPPI